MLYPEWVTVEENFSQNMKRRREQLGISQSDLGRQMKERGFPFHQQTIQRIENCERPVRLAEAMEIANLLGAYLPQLLTTPANFRIFEHGRKVATAHDSLENAVDSYNSARWELAMVMKQLEAEDATREALQLASTWLPRTAAEAVASLPFRAGSVEFDLDSLAEADQSEAGDWMGLLVASELEAPSRIDSDELQDRVESRYERFIASALVADNGEPEATP